MFCRIYIFFMPRCLYPASHVYLCNGYDGNPVTKQLNQVKCSCIIFVLSLVYKCYRNA